MKAKREREIIKEKYRMKKNELARTEEKNEWERNENSRIGQKKINSTKTIEIGNKFRRRIKRRGQSGKKE